MKILYAIQGTGNGHVSRAREIVPLLAKKGDVDVLISGTQADVDLPWPVRYRFYGLSFVFGKQGGVDLWDTVRRVRPEQLWSEINHIDVRKYDVVISDFEPVSSWACRLKGYPCIALSHQAGVMAPHAPKPIKADLKGELILQNYAPATIAYGFNFGRFGPFCFTPVIRSEIRALRPVQDGHYTVYLPAYDDGRLVRFLGQLPEVQWQVFSKHNKQRFTQNNVHIQPINNHAFIESLATCTGVLCGAGFETPAEALFLGKQVMVVPMKDQFEQYCNAAGAATLGVPHLWSLADTQIPKVRHWLKSPPPLTVDFPDETAAILDLVLYNHTHQTQLTLSQWQKKAGIEGVV